MGSDGTDGTVNKYAMPLDALQRSVQVPADDQVEEHPEPPPPYVLHEDRLASQKLVRIVGI